MEMNKLQVASIHDEIASQAISILGNKSHEEVLFFSRFEISVNVTGKIDLISKTSSYEILAIFHLMILVL